MTKEKKKKHEFKRTTHIKKLKFNHEEEKVADALGVKSKDIDEIFSSAVKMVLGRKMSLPSETTEDFSKNFSKAELAILASTLVRKGLREAETAMAMLNELFATSIKEEKDHSCEECSGECGNPDEQPYASPENDDTSYYIG